MNRQQAVDFVSEHSDDDDLDQADIDAAFTAIFEQKPDDVDRELGLWSLMVAAINNHSALAAIFVSEPGNVDQGHSLGSMVVAATDEDPSCDDDEDDEDEDDEPKREKYITINDDIDYWGSVPVNFDMGEEIAKITNAADDAGIVVYDGCEPSQETIDTGKEIDWSTEWCYSYEWSEAQWLDWFRKQ